MHKLLEILGELFDVLTGPSKTTVSIGRAKQSTFTLKQTLMGPDIEVSVTSRQIVYHQRYERWWIFDRHRTVYEVVGNASEEYHARLTPQFFEPVIYPMLCHPLLQWTEYPHVYAINAFLDRTLPSHETVRVTL